MFIAGTTIVLDPAGAPYTAIGASNLRAYIQGQDDVGHAAFGELRPREDHSWGHFRA